MGKRHPEYRARLQRALELRELGGHSHKEVGQRLGVSGQRAVQLYQVAARIRHRELGHSRDVGWSQCAQCEPLLDRIYSAEAKAARAAWLKAQPDD